MDKNAYELPNNSVMKVSVQSLRYVRVAERSFQRQRKLVEVDQVGRLRCDSKYRYKFNYNVIFL